MVADVRALVEGKRVAIVGRAGSIVGTGHGKTIDRADLVVRINWVLPIPPEQEADVGTRTDMVYHCRRARTARKTARALDVLTYRVSGKKRRRAARRYFKRPKKYRPTTGLMAALEALSGGAAEVGLYGFDCFRSGHVQEREPEGDDYTGALGWAHNPEEERLVWRRLFKQHPRLKPDRIFLEAVK